MDPLKLISSVMLVVKGFIIESSCHGSKFGQSLNEYLCEIPRCEQQAISHSIQCFTTRIKSQWSIFGLCIILNLYIKRYERVIK